MKKKLLGAIGAAVIMLAVVFTVHFNTNNPDLSNLSLANVEALAIGEGDEIECCSSCGFIYCGGHGTKVYRKEDAFGK